MVYIGGYLLGRLNRLRNSENPKPSFLRENDGSKFRIKHLKTNFYCFRRGKHVVKNAKKKKKSRFRWHL